MSSGCHASKYSQIPFLCLAQTPNNQTFAMQIKSMPPKIDQSRSHAFSHLAKGFELPQFENANVSSPPPGTIFER